MTKMVDILAPLEQEGTRAVVRKWLKSLGEAVAVDEPLVELDTDKVMQEVPAPVAGILHVILMSDGEEAVPGSVLGRIKLQSGLSPSAQVTAPKAELAPSVQSITETRYSPAVRRAAAEYGIDPATISGSGKGGRVTRADMDASNNRQTQIAETTPSPTPPAPAPTAGSKPQTNVPPQPAVAGQSALPLSTARSKRNKHTPMRLAIANHMQMSVSTAPHVTSVFEADFTAIMRHRDQNKANFASSGISLSYTVYIVAACVIAMKAVPEINSRWHDDSLEVFDDINIGVGTALGDSGLVVPVIKEVQNLSHAGVASKLQDLTTRARSGSLTPTDVRDGTFTISNYGVSGSLFALPIIINQPQSAILGVGKIEKRVVVREVDGVDTMQIRPTAYVSLTIDHRSLNGHQTNTWLTAFVNALESWPA